MREDGTGAALKIPGLGLNVVLSPIYGYAPRGQRLCRLFGTHRPKRIRELIEQQGCELLYLPTYSPDYNPIEEAFSKIKNLVRRSQPGPRRLW